MTTDAKKQAILTAISQIEKAYGKGSIMKMGESIGKLEIETIPTGAVPVDLALGAGGLPRGRIIEIFGPEASGKTTLALSIIAQAQKNGGSAALIDAEHALDPAWAQKVGVTLDDLLISQPDTGEQALEITETLIRSGAIDVVIIDSVAALVPRAEIEGEMGDSMMGVQARLMSQALRKLTGAISKSKTVVIFTNQLREKIGVMFGNPEVTPGGRALKFYSSVRIDIRKIDNIKEGDKVIGTRHRVKIVKNKIAPPFRVAEFDIMAEEGISKEGGLLDVALELGLVTKSGAFFRWGAKMLGQGRESAKEYFREHKKEFAVLEKEIWAKVKKGLPTKPKVTNSESEDEEILEEIAAA
ncbi:recombinase RecA [Candidatus Curtissbacteria bacterium RIFOXYD1_FULL_41_36]|uniref:Protein RecA n=1 Tax=Candidatus Curtissbacteria bacterium RIFOXYA1_FULL_41_14 TaxID=1797737 RepID=A0A1F5HCG6_9BACT|nr:MAG: Protein RecA [Candidatus Curtissbacteria bacterium GW2011_GWC2_41_21]OGD80125.1 MAG: recombinase RecA [Candidatus Curtissbacteria bacterium RIFCSPHIGHO2_01_FULL_34_40]OGD91493.1 MAG: recombinase RecA [Candidatus Curtissbacteria bacterium RIFCSPHIGHO2_12_FULL_41_13]OGE01725.1 MAG: recombinase RecA [Candidatus Curtissbacteria bacterium RIFOXYA1_FULL_41_14]OGE08496.1 MAG: recombinase RecA [Candidatus Curtissbacteria bacterium RIFOXYD1_FULL_41_36]OGE10972.1 MAG: recombinase RecA [Candidatu